MHTEGQRGEGLRLAVDARHAHDRHRSASGPHRTRCYAPSTSMYFDQFGNVLPCCINTVHPLGRYPDQRIADIWRSSAADQLRRALADDDLSLGCHDCHSSISAGNFDAINEQFDQIVARTGPPPSSAEGELAVDEWPRSLEFALSTRCNLRCTMCSGYFSSSIRKAQGLAPLPEPYGEAFVEEIRPFLAHAASVKFYGGEPLLAPVNFEILRALGELNPGCEVSITTNGTVWNERVRRVLEPLRTSITVSIDGASAPVYESIRLGASFDEVVAHLDGFAALERSSMSLAICAMRQNWTEVPDLVRLGCERGWPIGFNVVRYPQDHSLSSAPVELLDEVADHWKRSLDEAWALDPNEPTETNTNRLRHLLAEVVAWRDAATSVEVRGGSAAQARARRRSWIRVVAELGGVVGDDSASEGEDRFAQEMARLVERFEGRVAAPDRGRAVAAALATLGEGPLSDAERARFDAFAEVLAAHPVGPRLRRMGELPPELIAQGVRNEDPTVMAARFASYFPPDAPTPTRPTATT